MSLDVYLRRSELDIQKSDSAELHIFVRVDGSIKELTRAEWDVLYPEREPLVTTFVSDDSEVYSANITHNLALMADKAGIYKQLWRPDENGITHARQLITPLRAGLERLRSNSSYYREFNPTNGWGTYDGLVSFVENYLKACEEYPDAEVTVSR